MSRIVFLTVIIAFLGSPLFAENTDEHSWNSLNQLKKGDKVEVVEMSQHRHNGKFLDFADQRISLQVDGQQINCSRTNVFRVTLVEKKRSRNFLIGLGIGAAIGLTLGGVSAENLDYEKGPWMGMTAGIGAGIGGGIGALMATDVHQTIYRAEPELIPRNELKE